MVTQKRDIGRHLDRFMREYGISNKATRTRGQTRAPSGLYLRDYPQDGRWAYRELVEKDRTSPSPAVKGAALLASSHAAEELGVKQARLVFMAPEKTNWCGGAEGICGGYIGDLEYRRFTYNDHGLWGFYFPFSQSAAGCADEIWLKYDLEWRDAAWVTFHEYRHAHQVHSLPVGTQWDWYKSGQQESDADAWADSMMAQHWDLMSQAVLNVIKRERF